MIPRTTRSRARISTALKSAAAMLTAISLAVSPAFAEYYVLYKDSNTERISSGVTYEQQRILTDKGWVNLNILRANLDDPYTTITPLYSNSGMSSRTSLSSMFNTKSGIVGAINADFFDTASGATLGAVVDPEKGYVASGLKDGKLASFNISSDNTSFIDFIKTCGITVSTDSYSMNIDYKNKPYLGKYDRAIMYDRNWSSKSFGATAKDVKSITEVVVDGGVVTAVNKNGGQVAIPQNGFVLACTGTKAAEAATNFSVGQSINVSVDPYFTNLKTSVGGGSVLIKDGVIQSNLTIRITGRNPRTALGISQSGKEIMMLTIDGRTSSYAGVLESELAQILKGLGAYNAINLDGGGSTEMIVKSPYAGKTSIVNNPSDGTERRIYVGLGIASSAPQAGIKEIKISSDDKIAVKGGSRIMSINAVDSNYNRMQIEQGKVIYSVSGVDASVSGSRITFKSSGKATITASYQGVSSSMTMDVKDSVYDLVISPTKIETGFGKKIPVSVSGITKDGYRIKLLPGNVSFSMTKSIGSFDSTGSFISGYSKGQAIIRASFGGVSENIAATVGEDKALVYNFESESGKNATKASATPEAFPQIASFAVTKEGTGGSKGGKLTYDFTPTGEARTAAMEFPGGGLKISGTPVKFSVNVFGTYANEHKLRAKFLDAAGVYRNVDIAGNVDWDGWKTVEFTPPSGMKAPYKLTKIFLSEDNEVLRDTGYIVVDDICKISYSKNALTIPSGITKFVPLPSMKVSAAPGTTFKFVNPSGFNLSSAFSKLLKTDYSYTWKLDKKKYPSLPGVSAAGGGYSAAQKGNAYVMNVVNYSGSIRKSGMAQITGILDLKNKVAKGSAVIIVTSNPFTFSDPLEENLVFETLASLKSSGVAKSVAVVSPASGGNTSSSHKVQNGVDLVTIGESNYTPLGLGTVSYTTMKVASDGSVSYELMKASGISKQQ